MPSRPESRIPPRTLRRAMGIAFMGGLLLAPGCTTDTGTEVRADVAPTTGDAGVATTERTADSLWALAADLERAVAAQEPQTNTILAPVPIALGLAEAAAGGAGSTRDQLTAALRAGDDFDAGLDEVWRTLPTRSGERKDAVSGRTGRLSVELASTLWGQRDTKFGEPWLTTLAQTWGTGVRVTDFRSDPEEARRTINQWAAGATNNHITELLSRGDTDELTRFLATSAAYLKAPWRAPFSPSDTRLTDFHRLDGSTVTVPVMRTPRTQTRLTDGDGWVAVELPYLGDELRMTLVMPDKGRFAEIEAGLDGAALVELQSSLRVAVADVSVPRFGFTSDLGLDDALRAIGVMDAFDRSTADFAGVTTDETLALAGVVHQNFLGIDEEGTEATATAPKTPPLTDTNSTIAPTGTTSGTSVFTVPPATTATTTPPPRAVLFDRPFLVLVSDRGTGAPLFYGRVVSPRD